MFKFFVELNMVFRLIQINVLLESDYRYKTNYKATNFRVVAELKFK